MNASELVHRFHEQPRSVVLAVTGGGSRALAALLSVPGASRTILEAVVPYAAAALADWLGAPPEQACSSRTARAMAMAAFARARRLAGDDAPAERLLGLGLTASLATDRPKRGAHRLHLAWQRIDRTVDWTVPLHKGARSRDGEEDLVAALVLRALASATGLGESLEVPLAADEPLACQITQAPIGWQQLIGGQATAVLRREVAMPGAGRVIFPGAFNPPHAGHRQMAEWAQRHLGRPVEYELSIANVDKPPLDYTEIQQRLDGFAAEQPVWLTAAPTFVEKARLFPGATFVVGADTMARIAAVRYYGGRAEAAQQAWNELAERGSRFLVFARQCAGRVAELDDLTLPPPLASLCEAVPASEFFQGVSSTELRRQARLAAGEAD